MEPRYNKPQYNEVLGMTNDWIFFAIVIVKYVENNLDITKPRYEEQISLSVPWLFVVSRYCSIDRLKPLSIHRQRKITSSLYSYCEKGRKKCTRQFRKVLWVILTSLFFKEIWKNGTRGQRKATKTTKVGSTATAPGTVYSSYPILPFGDCRAHIFFQTTFLEIAV